MDKKEVESKTAKVKPQHDSLVSWDDHRRARELNEKAIVEVMFTNMEEKLELGKGACNDLLKYVKELARSQHEWVKSFGKLGNALDERLHYGSLENAVVVLKMHSINACSIYEEHNKILNENIATQLTQLVGEYSKHASKVMDAAKKCSKEYDQAREASCKAFSNYLHAFEEFLESERTGVVPAHDAWMAEKTYNHSLDVLKVAREHLSVELENIFEKFMVIEEKRIVSTKEVLQLHAAKQKIIFGRLSDGINNVEVASQDVDTIADRQLLLKQSFNRRVIAQTHLQKLTSQIQQVKAQHAQAKHGVAPHQMQQLADLQAQYSELRKELAGAGSVSLAQLQEEGLRTSHSESGLNLSKENESLSQLATQTPPMEKQKSLSSLEKQKEMNFGFRHSMEVSTPPPSVMEPPKTGILFRKKGKIMKSWKQTHCVLSSSGYLYMFTRQDKLTPKYTVPLANVSIHEMKDTEEPNVFELVVNQTSFFNSAKYMLQADSQETLHEWTTLIQQYCGSKK